MTRIEIAPKLAKAGRLAVVSLGSGIFIVGVSSNKVCDAMMMIMTMMLADSSGPKITGKGGSSGTPSGGCVSRSVTGTFWRTLDTGNLEQEGCGLRALSSSCVSPLLPLSLLLQRTLCLAWLLSSKLHRRATKLLYLTKRTPVCDAVVPQLPKRRFPYNSV